MPHLSNHCCAPERETMTLDMDRASCNAPTLAAMRMANHLNLLGIV
jgi:hypothetical protein